MTSGLPLQLGYRVCSAPQPLTGLNHIDHEHPIPNIGLDRRHDQQSDGFFTVVLCFVLSYAIRFYQRGDAFRLCGFLLCLLPRALLQQLFSLA